jgi:lauroyl/myristoyl acyltransferase
LAIRHLGGFTVSLGMRLLPRRSRFRVAMRMAMLATPLLRRTRIIRERLAMRVETAREVVTYEVLDVLTRRGVAFDPVLKTIDAQLIDEGLALGRGVLLVGPHAMLLTLFHRSLRDRGTDFAVVSADARRIAGTDARTPVIEPSFTFLLDIREALRGNRVVCAMIDSEAAFHKATFEVMTARGSIAVSNALFRLAVRIEAAIVFTAARIIDGEIVITHSAPSASDARSPEAVTAAFVSLLQKHVAELEAPSPS